MKGNCIGAHGKDYAFQNDRDVLGFEISLLSIWGCWQNKDGSTEPNSLITKVLKAKYFPNVSFMEAPLKSNASYSWKSMCVVRRVIALGFRWQVGGGQSIHI